MYCNISPGWQLRHLQRVSMFSHETILPSRSCWIAGSLNISSLRIRYVVYPAVFKLASTLNLYLSTTCHLFRKTLFLIIACYVLNASVRQTIIQGINDCSSCCPWKKNCCILSHTWKQGLPATVCVSYSSERDLAVLNIAIVFTVNTISKASLLYQQYHNEQFHNPCYTIYVRLFVSESINTERKTTWAQNSLLVHLL